MNQPLTPDHLAEMRELATRAASSSYEALTSHRGIEVFAVDPDNCKERIATSTPDRQDFVYLAVQAPTVVLALLAELDRVRAERDAFADRVDTLTAVAKSNKRHVQEMYIDIQEIKRERDELKTWHDNYVKGTKFAGRELRKRLLSAEADRDGNGRRPGDL
jgi:hypothetical protein